MAAADKVWAPESPAYDAFFKLARGNDVNELEKVLTPEIDINALQGNRFEGQAALHLAASIGNIEMVKALLAHGANINIFDQALEGCSQPLHMAAYEARTDIVKLLLDSGAERDAKGLLGELPLFQVLLHKSGVKPEQVETIRLLLDYGFDVNEAGVLDQAACRGHLPLVQLLLDRGACLSPTVLSRAAEWGDYEIVKLLLEKGAKVDGPHDDNPTYPLHAAAGAGNIDAFKLLLSHADEATISENFGALHRAASSGHVSLVDLMLDLSFDIEAKDTRCGNTPLHSVCAASRAHADVVRLLLSRGADISARNRDGDTPLHVVAWRSDPEVVNLLLQAGADTNARNKDGQTPLMAVASQITGVCLNNFHVYGKGINPRLESFKLLLTAGSDVNAKDVKGRTALHKLVMCGTWGHMTQGRLEAARLLVQGKVEVEALDVDGKMASQLFAHRRNPKLAQLLDVQAGSGAIIQRGHVGTGESKIEGRVARKSMMKL